MSLISSYDSKKDEFKKLKAKELGEQLLMFRNDALAYLNNTFLPNLIGETKENTSFKVLKRQKFSLDYPSHYAPWFRNKIKENPENFGEIINQMANIEGLLFCLKLWPEETVDLAHPTQTSDTKRDFDNDLILVDNDLKRYIEISDVIASGGDTNDKFQKDLNSLYRSFKKDPKSKYHLLTSSELWAFHKDRCRPEGEEFKLFFALSERESKQSLKIYSKIRTNFFEEDDFILIRSIANPESGFALLEIQFKRL
jgi:hypothetical protein